MSCGEQASPSRGGGGGGAFEDFIKSLESGTSEWVGHNSKEGKKGRSRKNIKNKISCKEEDEVWKKFHSRYLDERIIDVKCRESIVLVGFGANLVKTTFEMEQLPEGYYYCVAQRSGWVHQMTQEIFDVRSGVVDRKSRGFLSLELFNKNAVDIRLDAGCLVGQIAIKKFDY